MADIATVLANNPLIFWAGVILAAGIYIFSTYINNQKEESEVPEPSSLDQIVKPKVREHLENRGIEPQDAVLFKIGRDTKGLVDRYVETRMPSEMINPNPDKSGGEEDAKEIEVKIVSVKPENFVEQILQRIVAMFTNQQEGRKIYVFRADSFVDSPDTREMVVHGDTLSYTLGGLEVELTTGSKNVVNQAVEKVVSEKLLASLPNYTEKVDYLFPIHSQKMSVEEQKADRQGEW